MSDGHRTPVLDPGPPVVAPGLTYETIGDQINQIVLSGRAPRVWWLAFTSALVLLVIFSAAVFYLIYVGTGIWGINVPVAWGFAIINFVWWIGIGHAGTLISAILLLVRQQWRTSINRFAEAMTLFAVACAGLYPILHLGRPWLAYWLLPYPNTMDLWPQPRSALVWDVFAVTTYGTVSLLFWYVGLIPDLGSLRDRAVSPAARKTFGVLALGWRGSARHWARYEMTYLLLAGLATPLVISVHSVVSFDFATSIIPGWHTTIFPPYFVAGAIYSGFAMVLTLVIPIRSVYHLESFITLRHLDNMAKVMLATGWIVAYGYAIEGFVGWYSGVEYERYMLLNRMTGPYAPLYYGLLITNVLIPQVLWSGRVRRNTYLLFGLSLIINTGMWLERFIIVVTSLHRDFLPSSWGMYYPTVWDWMTYFGTLGLFFSLMFLFVRILPMISAFEMKELVHRTSAGAQH
ncbi:MAG: NrfD/PsrC family molybdoenzyme membrane anchor subunit [Bryobacteraceae bacterium]